MSSKMLVTQDKFQ